MSGSLKSNQRMRLDALNSMGVDGLVIILILSKEFILDFLGFGFLLNVAICCLIILRIITAQWRIPLFVYVAIALIPFFVALALFVNGDFNIAARNIARLIQVGLYGLYFLFLKTSQSENLQALYEKGFFFFNAILVLNMVIIVVQYVAPGAIMAVSDGTQVMQEDLMSGLFGYGSTHSVALYTSFVIVYDIGMLRRRSSDRRLLIIYIFVITLLSFYIATLNDNKALFFFLPISVFLCGVIFLAFYYKTAAIKAIFFVPIAIFVLFLLYLLIPTVHSFVEENIVRSINMAIKAWDLGAYVNGSDERFNIIAYALSLPEAWGFGDGLGQADMYQMGYHGFNHFGQSDFGSLVILGGFWIYFLILFFYVKVLVTPQVLFRNKKAILYFAIVFLLLCSSVFTQPFSQVRMAIPLILLGHALCTYWESFSQSALEDRIPFTGSIQEAGIGERQRARYRSSHSYQAGNIKSNYDAPSF